MKAKRVLLGWELGAGIGYVQKLREIALALNEAGFEPILALRTLELSGNMLSDLPFRAIQAPYLVGRLSAEAERNGLRPTGFADLMACNGFGSEDHLYSMVRGWRDLIDIIQPALVVGMYCPLLTLAAFRRIPSVLFGPPYCTPPADGDEFPSFFPDQPAFADQTQMLVTVQQVQRRFNAPLPDRLTEIYHGDHRCITAIPEIDPYREWRSEACDGIFEVAPPLQSSRGTGFYAYLAECGDKARIVARSLLASGLPGSIYVRDAPVDRWELPATDCVKLLRVAPDLDTVIGSATVVVHHGGLDTTQAAIIAGKPQVLIPQVLDQWLTATALRSLPFIVEFANAEMSSGDIVRSVRRLHQADDCATSALEFASSIRDRNLHSAKQRIIDACLQLLS
ncbi:MAG: hypothetical protein R3C53_16040 [Pirellulaceae bacterium]